MRPSCRAEEKVPTDMQYILPDKVYTVVKWTVLIILPALATAVSTIGPAWGMDGGLCQSVVTTITALSAFGGAVLGVSAVTAKPAEGGEADA